MCDVFIGYKSEDSEPALEIQKKLEESGISCYMASDKGFDDLGYSSQITEAIKNCKVFILVLSEKTQVSQWIAKELDYAISINKTILPFLIEDCPLQGDYKFYLSDVQHYQAFIDKESAFKKLTKDIIDIINRFNKGEEVVSDISLKRNRNKTKYISLGIAFVVICIASILLMFSQKTPTEKNEIWEADEPYYTVWDYNIDKFVYVVCPVTNTSEEYLKVNQSSIKLKNKDGNSYYYDTFFGWPNIIKPGETTYYNQAIEIEEGADTEFEIEPNLNMEIYDGEVCFLDASDVKISNTGDGKIRVSGKIINTTDQVLTRIYISVLLYDENNRLIANPSDHIVSQLSPGNTIGFSVQTIYSFPELTAEKVDHFDVDIFSYN